MACTPSAINAPAFSCFTSTKRNRESCSACISVSTSPTRQAKGGAAPRFGEPSGDELGGGGQP